MEGMGYTRLDLDVYNFFVSELLFLACLCLHFMHYTHLMLWSWRVFFARQTAVLLFAI